MYVCIILYRDIDRERERERDIYIYIWIDRYRYRYIVEGRQGAECAEPSADLGFCSEHFWGGVPRKDYSIWGFILGPTHINSCRLNPY